MATEQTRGEDGKFVPQPTIIDQADAKALEDKDDDLGGDDDKPVDADHPRLAMMKAARERRAKETGAEIEGDALNDKPDTSGADFKETKAEGAPVGDSKAAKEDDVPPHVATLADTDIVTMKVNGEEVKMPWGEAQKRLQLATATEQALEDAKAERAALKALRKTAEEEAKTKPTAVVKEEPAKPDVFAAAKAEKDKAFDAWEGAVRYGSEEEIAAAKKDLRAKEDALEVAREDRFKTLAQAAQPTGPDPLIVKEVAETQRATEDYIKNFGEDQKDRLFRAAVSMTMRDELMADLRSLAPLPDREDVGRMLSQLSDRDLGAHHQQARSRGLVRTLDKVLTAAGTKAREELKSRFTPTPGKVDPVAQRQQAKQNAPTQPRAASGRIPEAEEAKPKTAQDIMAETRARRGKA